jgi:hypothetical protein
MIYLFEKLMVSIWNRLRGRGGEARNEGVRLNLGLEVRDGQTTHHALTMSTQRRTMHEAVLGKTGSGKSFLLRHLALQDIAAGRGFLYIDLHGDATLFLLRAIHAQERAQHQHLSDRLILIQPADPIVSIGLNPLDLDAPDFVRIAEFAEVLKRRWGLDHFGPRTDELLRNSLFVLAANQLTLVELALFLSNRGFRTACLKKVENLEVRQYFELRYDQQSEAMQAVMREPILNKTSAFTADPHFRHIVGQVHSSFSLRQAMDAGAWVIVDLEKGRLGEQAVTLGSLILTVLKNALFARTKRSLFTVYCDEIQNLVASGNGIETMLSEARKFGVGIVTANQFLEQYPTDIQAAILSIGTHVFFQLSSQDAVRIAQMLDGGRPLAERLKNLSRRHAVVKSGGDRWSEIEVPRVRDATLDYTDLLNRVRYTKGRVRAHIERDIAQRQAQFSRQTDEVLDAWD